MITDLASWVVVAAIVVVGWAGAALLVVDACGCSYVPRRRGAVMLLGASAAAVAYAAVTMLGL